MRKFLKKLGISSIIGAGAVGAWYVFSETQNPRLEHDVITPGQYLTALLCFDMGIHVAAKLLERRAHARISEGR